MPGVFGIMQKAGDITQYYNPVGIPLQSWKSIPIPPQATAGQEWPTSIYSYRANLSLDQTVKFYNQQKSLPMQTLMGLSHGYGGTGAKAYHNATFLWTDMMIDIVSLDNDTAHVIVLIAK